MTSIISAVILAGCIAGLFVDLIETVMKFVVFIGKAIVNEPCTISIAGNLIFAFIFSFVIVLFFLM